jgi:lysyl-tRNA synthetase, class II
MSTRLPEEIVPDNDQTRARAAHLEEIKQLVGNAYPNKFQRTNIAGSAEGEDTITSIANEETLKRVVGDESFKEAFTLLMSKVKAGERPTAEELEPVNAKLNDINVRVSGRLATPPRVMGKVAFVHLSDGRERLQIYVRKQDARAISNDTGREVEEVESGWKLFQLLDHGDFAGVEGNLFVTKTGELSVHVQTIQFLSKALLPMPDKLHGISDPEIRQRQRYADLLASSLKVKTDEEEETHDENRPRELSTREVFERRSRIITQMRRYLDEHGYIEVETPMLSPIASGAAARPFKTHHNALDIDLYLRIAPELYLKRLVVGGFERVYEINRNFRNEGISTRHNPEFTMLEFYTAYKDVNWMMDFCEEMIRNTVQTVIDGSNVSFEAYTFDFIQRFRRLSMLEAIEQHLKEKYELIVGEKFDLDLLSSPERARSIADGTLNLGDLELPDIERLLSDRSFEVKLERIARPISQSHIQLMRLQLKGEHVLGDNLGAESSDAQIGFSIQRIFENVAEQHLNSPTFIHDFPKVISPLSKASPENPAIAERFELYVAGMEVANGFSELNDPEEQLRRFEDQTRQRERGDEEAMQMDLDYVRALSYGMPPAAGIGIGIDRLTMLLTNRRSIRDVILFPHMRPKTTRAEESEETRETEAAGEE